MIPVIIVSIGALIMLAAVINCRRLITIVKKTEYGSKWMALFVFMMAFLASYVFYGAILFKNIHLVDPNLLVSLVFLFGAIFVFMVVALNYSTFDGLLVRKQRELFEKITKSAHSLQTSAKRLATGSDAISQTSTQVAQGVYGIASDVEQQSRSTSEAHGLIDQIASAIDQVS
ncbi:MAG TPA: hypothetical protein DE036_10885, partial [Actinobacteria bacterium]|nr:hypothetical protein [Actinomycetota bacterium]